MIRTAGAAQPHGGRDGAGPSTDPHDGTQEGLELLLQFVALPACPQAQTTGIPYNWDGFIIK